MIRPIAKCAAGLDVHKAVVVCTILKEDSDNQLIKETKEYRTYHTDLKELAMELKFSNVECVSMESTGVFWKPVYEAIEEEGINACVVNARHIKNVPGRKTDIRDSEWIAELSRCGLLKPSFIPSKDIRGLRLLTRYRKKLSGVYSSEKNRMHKLLESLGIKISCVVSDINGISAVKMIEGILENKSPYEIADLVVGRLKKKKDEIIQALDGYRLNDRNRFLLRKLLNHIHWIELQINEMDTQIVGAIEPYREQWCLFQTIPGIDRISAAMLLAEIGVDMSPFRNSDHICSWAGMCPGNNESAGKRKSGKTRKGNYYVRSLLCEIANAAIKTNSQFKGMYKGLVIRRGHKRAIVAVGHKILTIVYAMLKSGLPYKDPGIDYEAILVGKNAPRWINALSKYGYISKEGVKKQAATT
jgi:transposase